VADRRSDGDAVVREKIAELPAFREVAARLHEVIVRAAPELQPRLWYGMPAYARSKSGPVICFFRVDGDDYVSLGLSEHANLRPEDGATDRLLESAWFLTELDEPTERRIETIVRRAAS
jgi:hypothetical protein